MKGTNVEIKLENEKCIDKALKAQMQRLSLKMKNVEIKLENEKCTDKALK